MLFFPWWVYLCIIGIIFSAYKLFTTAKEEEKLDQSFIEKKEGCILNGWNRNASAVWRRPQVKTGMRKKTPIIPSHKKTVRLAESPHSFFI